MLFDDRGCRRGRRAMERCFEHPTVTANGLWFPIPPLHHANRTEILRNVIDRPIPLEVEPEQPDHQIVNIHPDGFGAVDALLRLLASTPLHKATYPTGPASATSEDPMARQVKRPKLSEQTPTQDGVSGLYPHVRRKPAEFIEADPVADYPWSVMASTQVVVKLRAVRGT